MDTLKTIFVISPIGKSNDEGIDFTRIFLEDIVKPAAALAGGFKTPVRGDEVKAPGSVTAKVVADILRADVCVADLTQLNPNVMYEVAIAHAAGRPCILMKQEEADGTFVPPPFDFTTERTIAYGLRADKANRARNDLAAFLSNAWHEEDDDFLSRTLNPVRIAFQQHSARVSAEPTDRALMAQIASLTEEVSRLANQGDKTPSAPTANLAEYSWKQIDYLAQIVENEFRAKRNVDTRAAGALRALAEKYGVEDVFELPIQNLFSWDLEWWDRDDEAPESVKESLFNAAVAEFVEAREIFRSLYVPPPIRPGPPRVSRPRPLPPSASNG